MSTLNETFTEKNLFQKMNDEKTFVWADYFKPAKMDDLFFKLYGKHAVADSFTSDTVENIASDLAEFFVDRWNHIFNFMYDDKLLSLGYSETITETTVDDGTNTENETNDTVNKVSAYNESDFQNDKSENVTRETQGTNKNNRTRTYTRQGFNENFADARLKFVSMLQNDFIYDIIFKEVKSIITIPIYDSEL